MRHFPLTEWVDFARQTSDPEHTAAMQQHLDEHCTECLKTVESYRHLAEFARQELAYEPPPDALRMAKASFAIQKFSETAETSRELATLVFDSNQQGLVAGARSSAATARQLLYKSGSFSIDVQVQPKPGSDSVVVLGQLMDSTQATHGVGDIPVSLVCKGDKVSSKKTNDFGEFDFGYGILQGLQLEFGIANRKKIVVPIPDSTPLEGRHNA